MKKVKDANVFQWNDVDLSHSLKTFTNLSNESAGLHGNIENFIGWTQIPTGITRALLINGDYAKGSFCIPLATTEGALVASYSRGCNAVSASGGATTFISKEGIQRSPLFKFNTLNEVKLFVLWLNENFVQFQYLITRHSSHAHLQKMDTVVEGNFVIVNFDYYTAEAAGQNMITICTNAICEAILLDCPIKPQTWYLESNFSGDKKATANVLSQVRGKRVSAEAIINKVHLQNVLKTTAKRITDYWQASTCASIQSGTIGAQGHFANGLAALYLATGQDVACVAESAVGMTRMEIVDYDSLYIAVTLPNIIVGTVGGGTGLYTQSECLKSLNCIGKDSSRKLAEITAALILAGELSIAAALAEGHFASAHQTLGRNNTKII
jgi:hydroxymethylglutaryl-CoA reductase (NADPH)